MERLNEFSGLIGSVYDAVLKPQAWQPALEKLCTLLSARASSVHVLNPIDGRIGLFVEHGTDRAWSERLLAYGKMTPTGAAVLLAEVDEPICLFDLIDEEEFRSSRFYAEWCRPQGYYDMMGALIVKRPCEIGAVSVVRHETDNRFSIRERELMALVAPHVRRAVTLAGLLEHRDVSIGNLKSVVNQLASAIMIVERGGRLVEANLAARTLLDGGSPLSEHDGQIMAADPASDEMLRAAIARTGGEPQFIALSAEPRRIAAVIPIDAKSGISAVFVHAPEPDIPAIGRAIMEAFKLTPRETAVLLPMLDGAGIAEVAETLGVSVSTVRTHVQHLFAKTKTDRQSELVRTVMQALPPVRLS